MTPRLIACFSVDNRPVLGCTYDGRDLGAIVIGDSYAGSIMRSLEKVLPSKNLHMLDWSFNACLTVAGIKSAKDGEQRGDFVR